MNAIVFYFGIHVLVVKSNLIPNDGSDNSGLTFNKVNNDDPSSISKANTFDEMNDEIRMTRNTKLLNERNSNMTRKKVMKREITPITSSQTVGRITNDKNTDFRTAVQHGMFVVDKTRFIPKLLKFGRNGQFIMLRPYRFGKSFFLSMLRAFFEGDKDLFCSTVRPKMDICDNNDFTWEKYPILELNFGTLGKFTSSQRIVRGVCKLASTYGIPCDEDSPDPSEVIKETFSTIYTKNEKKGIVVLVDEYDFPVMKRYFDDVAAYKLNEEVIEGFFGAIKENSDYIRFTFIFGATKVTTVGETRNVLEDLTPNEDYSDMIGFTDEEIMKTYKERLEEIARERKFENTQMIFDKILHPYYNTYQFTPNGKPVFNALSVTMFLRHNPEVPQPYWAEKVKSRDLLKHTVKKFSRNTLKYLFNGKHEFKKADLEEKLDRENIMLGDETELAKILFQTGYMSMGKGPSPSQCLLGVTNNEAYYVLVNSLLEKMNCGQKKKMEDMLENLEFEKFIEYLEEVMANYIGHEQIELEIHFEKIVTLLLEIEGGRQLDMNRAVLTSIKLSQYSIGGKKADYVKKLGKVTVIFSFKRHAIKDNKPINITAALMKCNSIYGKRYAEEHNISKKKVICIVIIFNGDVNKDLKKEDKLKKTDCKFIKNWAALEWFQNDKTVELYNLSLNDEQIKEVAAYDETDQRIDPNTPFSEMLVSATEIFKKETPLPMSFEEFTDLIKVWQNTAKDPPETVREFTKDTEGVIKLIDKCYELVKDAPIRWKLTNIKNALKKKVKKSPDNGNIKPNIPVSKLLAPAAEIFKKETPMSFEAFTELIKVWTNTAKDPPETVREFIKDTEGVIKLIDKCYELVKDAPIKSKLTKIKNALKKKVKKSPDNGNT